jgi:energy-coupling factor transporter ATP-binding protein EcfA2
MQLSSRDIRTLKSLELQDLSIIFPNYPPVLKDFSFKFIQGKTYLLTGTTASGKSTLLKFLKGLIPLFYPATIYGEVRINDTTISLEEYWNYRTQIGYLFQDPPLQVIGSTVEKDIAFGLENLAYPNTRMKNQLLEIADRLDFTQLLSRTTTQLSGGELALTALASILILEPTFLLLDEFTAFLDSNSRRRVYNIIKEIQNPNRIIIMVSHQIKEVLPLVDEVLVLDKGKLLLHAPKERFITSNYHIIKHLLRIPEIFHLGIALCAQRGIEPNFDSKSELIELIGRK